MVSDRMKSTVFLGGGRITSALLAGLRLRNYRQRIVVYDRNRTKMTNLRRLHGVTIETDLTEATAQAGLLIVAVQPSSVRKLLLQSGDLGEPGVAISLAAGIPLAKLRELTCDRVRWARAMPSPACRMGIGLTALAFPRNSPESVRKRANNFFAHVGKVVELPESRFDAFTVAYSPSHGYHAMSTLAAAAEAAGLDAKTAALAAAHALADSIISWREGTESLTHLLREATTPGGIAAAVMRTMDRAGYRELVKRSLRVGMQQARANARN